MRPPTLPSLRPLPRDTTSLELMDDPDCDRDRLFATYAQFRAVNALVAGWRRVYLRDVRPVLDRRRASRLLDIGFGGGDIPLALARWAARDGLRLEVTAIDPDERAHEFVETRGLTRRGVDFRAASSGELVAAGERFDIVTSNHLLHHLDSDTLNSLLADSAALAPLALHSDIERGRLALAAFDVATKPLDRGSFVHYDGTLSIRRSYTAPELRDAVPEGWLVRRQFPYRLLLTRDETLTPQR
ncbi:2-polyprenyl-3-methyl-5-hydroxy-6-metoxy-1,4-benzoquinol methylase [Pseudoclavibacter sp. JAI123]|uniref:class I SAM-dependent methyltransferase n=1 Tax=Pseudoclavibacter sp. JAI123 TaxID=2723065 RepID=UPI0017D17E5F|nr:class I SAM-dependent methyltransferase [Pseudoclavibacter sp. JAI123]NYF14772.1 2-polyprenyl-3-methyl-5-hydroxy-6-metoxy-1,4-benzoquinol methylase [Pseudoclavibacter sp. JAI123]